MRLTDWRLWLLGLASALGGALLDYLRLGIPTGTH